MRGVSRPTRTLPVALALLAAVSAAASPSATTPAPAGTVRVYVGTYTAGASRGIYRLRLDLATGALTAEGTPTRAQDPSFLELSADGSRLYAVNETGRTRAETGSVSAFAVDARTGALTLLNRQPSRGAAPCHLALDRTGRHLLVANYWGGSVAVFPVLADGRLGRSTAFDQHEGENPTPRSEPGPHAHAVALLPDNTVALVADLGLDALFLYDFDAGPGTLRAHQPPRLELARGAGPRHLVPGSGGRRVYVINELTSTISVVETEGGALKETQAVSTLPEGFTGQNDAAEIALSPDGRFLYGSNRGHDSIAIFAVDADSGRLTPKGHRPTGGKTPRHFAIDPTGAYLLAANQESDAVSVFRIAPATGLLEPVGAPVHVPRPVCLRMATPRS